MVDATPLTGCNSVYLVLTIVPGKLKLGTFQKEKANKNVYSHDG
jgi:hypothetical protein